MRFDDPVTPNNPTRAVASQSRTIAEMFLARVARTAEHPAFRWKNDGEWKTVTWRAFHRSAAGLASYLIGLGLQVGDKLTIVGSTRPQWAIADIAGQLAGVVTVGAYPTLTAEQLAYIIQHSDSKVAFAEGRAEVEKLLAVREACRSLKTIVVWDSEHTADLIAKHSLLVRWQDVVTTPADEGALRQRVEATDEKACALIVYTSGTTGPPKGAMLSHNNVLCVLRHETGIDLDQSDHALSFLPMAHVAERILGFYGRINHGTSTAFATSIPALLDELKEVRPTLFGSVPRIFEKAYDRVRSQLDDAPPLQRRVFAWAESVGRRRVQLWQQGRNIPWTVALQNIVADRLVFLKLREVFGGRVKFFVTGAAPIPREVLDFFWASGFRVFEAYGMTEGTVISHINRPGAIRLGSVGKVLDYAECKLAQDGEILIRGGLVFLGYYKDEAATREAVDEDGWLHTGDIGRIDDDGFLFIVDRKKHIIITAGGKNLAPANIENELKPEEALISQVHAHGDRRAYVTALVTVSPMEAIGWAQTHGLLQDTAAADRMRGALLENPLANPEGLQALLQRVTAHDAVRQRVVAAVRRGNQRLARVERVKRLFLLDREFSVADNELTPTMKVRRKAVEAKFQSTFDRLYAEPDFGLEVEPR